MIERRMVARLAGTRRSGDASIHEDGTARDYGYSGALIPGIDIGAWLMELLCDLWGLAWIERGTIELKNSRPVYDTQEIVLRVIPEGGKAALEVTSAQGEMLARGSATLPDAPLEVDAADYPFRPFDAPLKKAEPGGLTVGQPLGGSRVVVDRAYLGPLLDRAMAKNPLLAGDRVHPLALQQSSTWDSIGSFDYATPGMHVWGEAIHLRPVQVGAELSSAGRIIDLWERKGNHYMRTEQLVYADGAPAALMRRDVIYWMAKVAA